MQSKEPRCIHITKSFPKWGFENKYHCTDFVIYDIYMLVLKLNTIQRAVLVQKCAMMI